MSNTPIANKQYIEDGKTAVIRCGVCKSKLFFTDISDKQIDSWLFRNWWWIAGCQDGDCYECPTCHMKSLKEAGFPSNEPKTTEQRIFDRLAEIGLDIDREVLRFVELTRLLPESQHNAAACKCGTLMHGIEQQTRISTLESSGRIHYTIISALNTSIVAAEKRIARERSRSAKLMNTIKRLRKGA